MERYVVCMSLFVLLLGIVAGEVPALFAFGDSLVDNGNNNVLWTMARANHSPYGVDFIHSQPTGRWSNGRLVIDFIASFLDLPSPPAYHEAGDNILKGANFASASSGVLPMTHTGGARFFSQQVNDFAELRFRLIERIGYENSTSLISKSIFYITTANNDINNAYRENNLSYVLERDVALLFVSNIQRLYELGARKFVITGLSAVGCIPINQINGECAPAAQRAAADFNVALNCTMEFLRSSLEDIQIVIPNFYDLMVEVHDNPGAYGFTDAVHACCPVGTSALNCSETSSVCKDRNKFAFWDGVHQTEAFNKIAARLWWEGAYVSPFHIRQLATLFVVH